MMLSNRLIVLVLAALCVSFSGCSQFDPIGAPIIRNCIFAETVDIDADLPLQSLDENVVTIIEKWESLEALRDHLNAPHMLVYKEKVKDIVEGVSIKVLQEA